MLNFAICDDEKIQIDFLKEHVCKWANMRDCSVQVKEFSNAENFLFQYEDCKNFDILILDIEMGKMSGVELAKEIRKID